MAAKTAYNGKDADLESLRVEIDKCDMQIVDLLLKRFELSRKVGIYKALHGLPIQDKAREEQLLSERRQQASESGNYSVDEIFKQILEISRRIQMDIREEFGMDGPCC